MEFAVTLGLPPWKDAMRPCFDCSGFGSDMFETAGIRLDEIRWSINEDEDYYVACSRCENLVELRSVADIESVERYLRYDTRQAGSKGRSLTRDVRVNGVQLREGDRLEPSDSLADVGALREIATFPTTIVFWRPSAETLTRHRNPLFDREIGITPKRTLTVDVLHSFFLGVLNTWATKSIWKLILCGAYGNLGTASENLHAAILVLRDALMRWYKDLTEEDLTRVADLTVKMVGKKDDQKLKTKGAET